MSGVVFFSLLEQTARAIYVLVTRATLKVRVFFYDFLIGRPCSAAAAFG